MVVLIGVEKKLFPVDINPKYNKNVRRKPSIYGMTFIILTILMHRHVLM